MVKFFSSTFTYDYSFPAVSLAYFLRYPNPYSTHVHSTDVISRNYDPDTQRITTVRLHLKRSKLPSAIQALLPKSLLGTDENGNTQSYILEKSTVDIKQGWMETESRNLELTGILSVVEKQRFVRLLDPAQEVPRNGDPFRRHASERTDSTTTVVLLSRIGENMRRRRARLNDASSDSSSDQEASAKVGFFRSWTTSSMQRSIEAIGLRRAEGAQPKATEGMKCVLERLRNGGLVGVLEGMRRDRELMFAGKG